MINKTLEQSIYRNKNETNFTETRIEKEIESIWIDI